MQLIDLKELDKYKHYSAIAFMDFQPSIKSIIIDIKDQNPIMYLSKLIELGVAIKKAYLENALIALSIDEFTADGFAALEAKFILTESFDIKLQKSILRFHQWLIWDESHLYCNKCAGALKQIPDKIMKQCIQCNHTFFPTIAPAVMVLIHRDNKILMARSPHFRPGMYALIAGFIDIGETAEEAVHREVMEEVGLKIYNLEYFATQSWPFPNSFMVAFKAHYYSGEITIDPSEIEHADWFDKEDLPTLPPYASIAKILIESMDSVDSGDS